VLGETRDELGGSEFYQVLGETGLNVPTVDTGIVLPLYRALSESLRKNLVTSCHAVTRGGLAVHLALVAMGGELGMDLSVEDIPRTSGLSPTRTLYSESCGRFVATVDPSRKQAFENRFSGMHLAQIGLVTDSPRFIIRDATGTPLIDERILDLKKIWQRPFGDLR